MIWSVRGYWLFFFPAEDGIRDLVLSRGLGDVDKRQGLLYSAEKPVPLAIEKQELHEKFHAEGVDMESAAIAKVACDAQINFIAVRCIVDRSDCDLPAAATSSFKDNGKVDVIELLKELTQHPLQLVPLIRLGLNYYSALRHLRKAATLLRRCL